MFVSDLSKAELQYELSAARCRLNDALPGPGREQAEWDVEDIEDELSQF